ncbi:hypothetical protein SmJEL517_g05417 [Synchytrium microbalum]|uniref:NodB homology domain-containing protein n=1 Tax=Synchytrium microbalum TaxID=1806994 RepID=A0A507BP39_9FUNG|nr:uncharacterized protein SmJEL517_g05417 [Synchytrium microbalum]TPX31167.1 hypothetical protein SmJEL517_g05417 [Synchytrium microbalum]
MSSISTVLAIVLGLQVRLSIAQPPAITMPAAWPPADETVMIADQYLQDPLVTNALAYVQSVVDPSILGILPSTYNNLANVTYHADATETCYWPRGGCTRASDIEYCPSNYQWGLTYDDAPSINLVNGTNYNDTIALVNLLGELDIKATFFVVGTQAWYFPTGVQAILNEDHHLASHTWSHHPMTSLTNGQAIAELMYTQALLYNTTGLLMRYWRAPYGDIDDRIRAIASALGFVHVAWNATFDSFDSDVAANAAGYTTVMSRVTSWLNQRAPLISLQHTLNQFESGTSASVLRQIQNEGGIQNSIMTIPQCLGDQMWYKNKNITKIFNSCTIPGGGCPDTFANTKTITNSTIASNTSSPTGVAPGNIISTTSTSSTTTSDASPWNGFSLVSIPTILILSILNL